MERERNYKKMPNFSNLDLEETSQSFKRYSEENASQDSLGSKPPTYSACFDSEFTDKPDEIFGYVYDNNLSDENRISINLKRPVPRAVLKGPCPSQLCDPSISLDWRCYHCEGQVEYALTDQQIYCKCGGRKVSLSNFWCSQASHGDAAISYPSASWSRVVNSLELMPVLNILILGETGVGKTTFINAFVNYLTFGDLDEAINDDTLRWVVPCSFSTQHIANGQYIQQTVKIGTSSDEHEGHGGQAATQKTKIYTTSTDDAILNLIDTPGVGDTRGVEKDHENMMNIISTIRQFQYLHGILILVKSNSARLTVMFRFCVQELLSHLHKDAARSMVFGFTNTRISNFMPGDTFQPLKNELSKHKQVGLELTTDTAYCFDSESFRFLAAQKQGVHMENIDDFRRSWKRSTEESRRLVKYFGKCVPHEVQSTLSLNRALELVSHLTKPMADISYRIQITIKKNKESIQQLRDNEIVGKDLKQRLHFQRVVLKYKVLDQPRTVCTHGSCVEYKKADPDVEDTTTIYKTLCHNPCYLRGVPTDCPGVPEINGCFAFQNSEGKSCSLCGHGRDVHQHVMYEYEEENQTVKDDEVEKLIQANADDRTVKSQAIKTLEAEIKSCEDAERQIQEAAAQFCYFLKVNSITPYNDAMLSYLDHLIREERDKVEITRSNRDRLEGLEKRRREYEQRINVLTKYINHPTKHGQKPLDEAGIKRLINDLYGLKHWGSNLQNILSVVDATESQFKTSTKKSSSYVPKFFSSAPSKSNAQVQHFSHFDSNHGRPLVDPFAPSTSHSANSNMSVPREQRSNRTKKWIQNLLK